MELRYASTHLAIGLFILFATFIPAFVSADSAVIAQQPGSMCPSASIAYFQPYVYQGNLHSFEYVIEPNTYAATQTSVSGEVLPTTFTTRIPERLPGKVVVHVDTPSMPVGEAPLAIEISLASNATSSQAIPCTFNASFSVDTRPIPVVPPKASDAHGSPPVQSGSGISVPPEISAKPAPIATGDRPAAPEYPQPVTTTTPGGKVAGTSTMHTDTGVKTGGVCSPRSAASAQLWGMLLALYLALIVILFFAPLSAFGGSMNIVIAVIALPAILLLGAWYYFDNCFMFKWFPFGALVIGIAGLLSTRPEVIAWRDAYITVRKN